MIGRQNKLMHHNNHYKVPKHIPLPKPKSAHRNNPYTHADVAKEGAAHLLMLRNTTPFGEDLMVRLNKLTKGGIKVKDNGTFIAHVVGYEIPFVTPPQIVVRKPHSKNNSKSKSTKLNLHGVNHVWNLTYPNGLKTWETPWFKHALKKKLNVDLEDMFDVYKRNHNYNKTNNTIKKSIQKRSNIDKRR